MPHIETPSELADAIADMLGIYGVCPEGSGKECNGNCRPHFTCGMTERIRQAVANENLLAGPGDKGKGDGRG